MIESDYLREVKTLKRERQERERLAEIIKHGGYCRLCGYSEEPSLLEETILEDHHIAGRKNDPMTVYVCPTCHKKLSISQYSWDKRWMGFRNTPRIIRAIMLRGISDLLFLIAKKLRELSDGMLKEGNSNG